MDEVQLFSKAFKFLHSFPDPSPMEGNTRNKISQVSPKKTLQKVNGRQALPGSLMETVFTVPDQLWPPQCFHAVHNLPHSSMGRKMLPQFFLLAPTDICPLWKFGSRVPSPAPVSHSMHLYYNSIHCNNGCVRCLLCVSFFIQPRSSQLFIATT